MVSLIIPSYNEVDRVEAIEGEIKKLKGDFEVIFTDGFSSDGTYEKISYPKIQKGKMRSVQMNEAALLAKGDYLWFVHVDSLLDPRSIEAIEASGADLGCFKLAFDWDRPIMKIIAFNSSNRVRHRNIAFGDQGIFIKKDLFEKIGGYKEIPIMEDYQLSMDLKSLGYSFKLLDTVIVSSARKFRKNGPWKTMVDMQIWQHRYRKHKDYESIFKEYY